MDQEDIKAKKGKKQPGGDPRERKNECGRRWKDEGRGEARGFRNDIQKKTSGIGVEEE